MSYKQTCLLRSAKGPRCCPSVRAIQLVLESARISALDAQALGVLDEIVEQDELIQHAIEIVHPWTPPSAPPAPHLKPPSPSSSRSHRRDRSRAQRRPVRHRARGNLPLPEPSR